MDVDGLAVREWLAVNRLVKVSWQKTVGKSRLAKDRLAVASSDPR